MTKTSQTIYNKACIMTKTTQSITKPASKLVLEPLPRKAGTRDVSTKYPPLSLNSRSACTYQRIYRLRPHPVGTTHPLLNNSELFEWPTSIRGKDEKKSVRRAISACTGPGPTWKRSTSGRAHQAEERRRRQTLLLTLRAACSPRAGPRGFVSVNRLPPGAQRESPQCSQTSSQPLACHDAAVWCHQRQGYGNKSDFLVEFQL